MSIKEQKKEERGYTTLFNLACHKDSFAQGEAISTADLRAYLMRTAEAGSQKEGMMTQYWQLDAEPVESMEYWTESERYLREDEQK